MTQFTLTFDHLPFMHDDGGNILTIFVTGLTKTKLPKLYQLKKFRKQLMNKIVHILVAKPNGCGE